MKVTETESWPANPTFRVKEYDLGYGSAGRVLTDKATGDVRHEITAGEKWLTVTEEVFQAWLMAYDAGRGEW